MKTFAQFITEATSKTVLDKDKFLDYLNTHCSDFATPWKNGERIYRGSYMSFSSLPKYTSDGFGGFIIHTDNTTRTSAHTSNYYTIFLDDLIKKEHSNFPLRSKSIICSTNLQSAKNYVTNEDEETGNTMVVIPTNGCKIGVVGTNDIWELSASVNGVSYKTHNFNLSLDLLGIKQDMNDIKEKSEQFKKMPEEEIKNIDKYVKSPFIKILHNGLYETLTSFYTDILRQCTSKTPSSFSTSGNHEVWVGNGDVVVFDTRNLEKTKLVVKNGKWVFE